jgi:hypothetical protein
MDHFLGLIALITFIFNDPKKTTEIILSTKRIPATTMEVNKFILLKCILPPFFLLQMIAFKFSLSLLFGEKRAKEFLYSHI